MIAWQGLKSYQTQRHNTVRDSVVSWRAEIFLLAHQSHSSFNKRYIIKIHLLYISYKAQKQASNAGTVCNIGPCMPAHCTPTPTHTSIFSHLHTRTHARAHTHTHSAYSSCILMRIDHTRSPQDEKYRATCVTVLTNWVLTRRQKQLVFLDFCEIIVCKH